MLKITAKGLIKFPNAIYFVSIFLIILLALVYLVYEAHRKLTISAKQDYIGLVSANLISTDQSMDELITTLSSSNSNYEKIVGSAQVQGSANYSLVVENNEKNLSQIELLKENLDFQKNLLDTAKTPEGYESLKNDFSSYYTDSGTVLDELGSIYEYENTMLQSFNVSLHNKNISDKAIWAAKDSETIKNYFKTLKFEAEAALARLKGITRVQKYESYHNLHLNYLELLNTASQEVIVTLENATVLSFADDQVDSIEMAYKISVDAQDKIAKLSEKISSERLRLFSIEQNMQNIENLSNAQKTLEDKIKNFYQQLYIESKSDNKLNF